MKKLIACLLLISSSSWSDQSKDYMFEMICNPKAEAEKREVYISRLDSTIVKKRGLDSSKPDEYFALSDDKYIYIGDRLPTPGKSFQPKTDSERYLKISMTYGATSVIVFNGKNKEELICPSAPHIKKLKK